MAHQIESRDTQVGVEIAWHKLTIVEPVINKQNSRICYTMAKQPLKLPSGTDIGFYGIVSADDGQIIGNPVGSVYQIVSNEQILDMVSDALAGVQHQIVSVGSIDNRSRCFVSIKLAESELVAAGRTTTSVLNVLWGHGGKFGITAKTGMTVVVCANTFAISLGERGDFAFKMNHRPGSLAKLENMGQAIDRHLGVAAQFKEAMDDIAEVSCDQPRAERIFAGFLVRDDDFHPRDLSTRTENQISRLTELFSTGKGNRGSNLSDVFHSATDYYTHESSGGLDSAQRQFESSDFGNGLERKTEMLSLLTGRTLPKLGDLPSVERRGDKVLLALH